MGVTNKPNEDRNPNDIISSKQALMISMNREGLSGESLFELMAQFSVFMTILASQKFSVCGVFLYAVLIKVQEALNSVWNEKEAGCLYVS